jgi:uncharacterized membrane protein YgaE (UPF0421/DUF939 family)
MAEYRAKKGQEDRHGEMTGAITVNMVLCMLPLGIFFFFIGPLFLGTTALVIIGIICSLIMPVIMLKPSQQIWAWLSEWADRFES